MTPCHQTPTGLRIGAAYVPRPQPITGRDALRLQKALLDPRTRTEPSLWRKVAALFWGWA